MRRRSITAIRQRHVFPLEFSPMRSILLFLATCGLGLAAAAPAFADAPAEVALIERHWSEAFARWDIDELVSLYTSEAQFLGSKPDLYLGQSGVRHYFETLPKGYKGAAFSDSHAVQVTPDVIVAAALVTFTGERDGKPFAAPYRITFTLVKSGDDWKIASHHASPKT
jgi:ketosteroid isomerase-like protein